jgi:hypothetical protein
MRNNKKAQTWYVDVMVGIAIFILAFTILMKSYVNLSPQDNIIGGVKSEAILLSEILLSEGIPTDWNQINVIQPGIIKNNRIDEEKVHKLKEIDYNSLKVLYPLRYDYYVYFENKDGLVLVNGSYGFGKPGITKENLLSLESPKNLVRISRVSIYNSSIVRMVVLVWS